MGYEIAEKIQESLITLLTTFFWKSFVIQRGYPPGEDTVV